MNKACAHAPGLSRTEDWWTNFPTANSLTFICQTPARVATTVSIATTFRNRKRRAQWLTSVITVAARRLATLLMGWAAILTGISITLRAIVIPLPVRKRASGDQR